MLRADAVRLGFAAYRSAGAAAAQGHFCPGAGFGFERLDAEEHLLGLLQALFYAHQELHGFAAIDDAVVV